MKSNKTKAVKPAPVGQTASKNLSRKAASPSRNDGREKSGVRKDNAGEESKNEMLEKYFVELLRDIYWAEKHMVTELDKLFRQTTSEELQQALSDHRDETEVHVDRLEQVFETIGMKPSAKKCEAITGLFKELEQSIAETQDHFYTRDVALIVGLQKAEHYEIATYGSLAQIANTLGHFEVADLLEDTLEEEKQADRFLTQIAESGINQDAAKEHEEEEAAEEE